MNPESACGAGNLIAPFPVSPSGGKAGGTAASAALRLGHGTDPKQNAHPRSGPVRKWTSGRGFAPDPIKLSLAETTAPE
jgi:hypothetical protein